MSPWFFSRGCWVFWITFLLVAAASVHNLGLYSSRSYVLIARARQSPTLPPLPDQSSAGVVDDTSRLVPFPEYGSLPAPEITDESHGQEFQTTPQIHQHQSGSTHSPQQDTPDLGQESEAVETTAALPPVAEHTGGAADQSTQAFPDPHVLSSQEIRAGSKDLSPAADAVGSGWTSNLWGIDGELWDPTGPIVDTSFAGVDVSALVVRRSCRPRFQLRTPLGVPASSLRGGAWNACSAGWGQRPDWLWATDQGLCSGLWGCRRRVDGQHTCTAKSGCASLDVSC
jgi:hypothetical protein